MSNDPDHRTAARAGTETRHAPTLLESALPVYDFTERHARKIRADADTVWTVLSTLRMDQLTITRPLVALRLGPHRDQTRALFEAGPVTMFDLAAPHYAIAGAIARPWQLRPARQRIDTLSEFMRFDEPGWVKYLTDFQIEELGRGGVRLSTQTRGRSTDAAARRRFAPYWWAIRPASGLIRRNILATVARRAQTTPPSSPDGRANWDH